MDLNDDFSLIDNLENIRLDYEFKKNNYCLSKEQIKYFELEDSSVIYLVNDLLNKKKEFNSNPLDFVSIIQYLNLNVEYKDNFDKFVQLDHMNKTIYINNDCVDMKLKLYQVAVEIGKFVLNNNFGESNDIKRQSQANIFAVQLLMPYSKFRNNMLFGYSIDNLSDYFNVSYEIAKHRYAYISKKLG